MSEKEEKPMLTDEEMQVWLKKKTYDVKYLGSDDQRKLKNTIENLAEEFKSIKGLKGFITTGVLVSPQLILSADAEKGYRSYIDLGMRLTAIGGGRFREAGKDNIVQVDLRVQDVERLIKLLPALLEAARNRRDFKHLKEIYDAATQRRRY